MQHMYCAVDAAHTNTTMALCRYMLSMANAGPNTNGSQVRHDFSPSLLAANAVQRVLDALLPTAVLDSTVSFSTLTLDHILC